MIFATEPLKAAHVPDEIGFATKPALALAMVRRAIEAELPFAWVAADSVHGVGEIEMALRRVGKGYGLGVNANSPFNAWIGKPEVVGTAAEIAEDFDAAVWRRLSAGPGPKGERLHDRADLEAAEDAEGRSGLWTLGLLIRRHIADGDLAFFATWCPAGTSIETLVSVEGRRWAIEDGFETAKNELGLDHKRDVLLAWLAPPRLAGHAGLRHARHHPPQSQPDRSKKKGARRPSLGPPLIRWSVQEIRRVASRLARRRIHPADVIAGSLWRRAHQAAAQQTHLKSKTQP